MVSHFPRISFPPSKVVFSLSQIYEISTYCDFFHDAKVYWAAFLLTVYTFSRISNVAPHFQKAFDPTRYLLKQDFCNQVSIFM